MRSFLLFAGMAFAVLLSSSTAFSQCQNQVVNTADTSVVAGVTITVTSFGTAISNSTYCSSTSPYMIGHLSSSGLTSNSGYTFEFNPPVDSITLNFSGVSNTPPYQEILMLTVNGNHYSIPSVGTLNGCDALADLTPQGDITGCSGCSVSGWLGTKIAGPISSLTVTDSAALNGVGGNQALFSLFFCHPGTSGIADNISNSGFDIYPNPVSDFITISGQTTGILEIVELSGKVVLTRNLERNSKDSQINLSELAKGIYLAKLGSKVKKIIKL